MIKKMKRIGTSVIVLGIALIFLFPSAMSFETDNKEPIEKAEKFSIPTLPRDGNLDPFPGFPRLITSYPGIGDRDTRAGRDVSIKKIEKVSGGIDSWWAYSWGVVGSQSKIKATIEINGSAGPVSVWFITGSILDLSENQQDRLWDDDLTNDNVFDLTEPVEHKEMKTVESAGGGEDKEVTFDWTPTASNLYWINITVLERDDPKPSNNMLFNVVWINAVADDCENEGNSEFSKDFPGGGGNDWHVSAVQNDPDAQGEYHTITKAWYSGQEVTHTYANNRNMSIVTPVYNLHNDFDTSEYPVFCSWKMNGISAGENDFMFTWAKFDTFEDWMQRTGDTSGAEISDNWYFWVFGEEQFIGLQLSYTNINTAQLRIGFVSDAIGTAKGFYIDDYILWGYQNYTDVGWPEQIPFVTMDMDKNPASPASDTNSNEIIDLSGDPGEELEFKFDISNTGTAKIGLINFEVLEKPEGWDNIEFQPTSIDTNLDPGGVTQVTATVTIPDDAEASVDFSEDSDDKKYSDYFFEFEASATGTGTPTPEPNEDSKSIKFEALVNEIPSIEVTIGTDNLTGVQGAQLEYTINIENTGNCNLTDDIDAEISITVEDKPPGLWTVNLGKSTIDNLEYEEDEDVSIKVTSPPTEKAGFYEVEVQVTLGDFESPDPIIITAGVEQFFGLELDFKDRNDNSHEVDPTQANQVFVPITFEVANKGNGYDIAKFVVTADDDEDEEWFDLGDEDFIELDPVGGLHDEEDFTVEFNVPEDAVHGDHKFTVMAVSDNDPSEETETKEKEIVFTIFRPDLQVSTDIKLDPAVPLKGQDTEIEVRIFNNGTTSATSFSVYLYVDDALVDFRPVNILQKGQLTDLAPFIYVFEDNKEYNIKVVVDPTQGGIADKGNVTEMDELNNEASRTTEVIAPDLKFKTDITDITVSTDGGMETLDFNTQDLFDVLKDVEYTITFTVENDGDADAKKVKVNFKVVYETLDGEKEEYQDNSTPKDIKAGKSTTVDFEWAPKLHSKEYTVIVTVDPEDDIPEETESNNELEQMLFMTNPPPEDEESSPGFEVFLAIAVLLGVCVVLYRKRR